MKKKLLNLLSAKQNRNTFLWLLNHLRENTTSIVFANESSYMEKLSKPPIMSEEICIGLSPSNNNIDFGDVGGIIQWNSPLTWEYLTV